MISRYAEFLLQKKWIVFTFVLLFISSFFSGLADLKTNYHMRYWLDKEENLIKRLNYFEDNFGNDESVVIGLHNSSGVINLETLRKFQALSDEVSKISDVRSIQSVLNLDVPMSKKPQTGFEMVKLVDLENYDFDGIKNRIEKTEFIQNLYISKDLKTTALFANLKPTIINNGEVYEEIDYRTLTSSLRTIVEKYQSDDFQLYLTGTPIIQNDFSEVSERDLALIMPLLFTFMGVILFYLFRSFIVLILAFTVISLTNTTVYGFAGLLGFEFENMLSVVPLIILTICLADIVHVYMTYQAERVKGAGKNDAIKKSVTENFVPTLLTSVTTGIGFFSLAASHLVPVKNMGLLAGFGVLMAWLLSITIFPIFLSFTKEEKFKASKSLTNFSFQGHIHKAINNRTIIVSLFLVLSIIGGFFGTQNIVNTDPLKFFKEEAPVRKSADFILNNMGAVTGPEIIIHSGYREGILEPDFLKKVDTFGLWLKENQFAEKTISIVEMGKELYKLMNKEDPSFAKIPDDRDELIDLIFDNREKLRNTMSLSSRVSEDMESIRFSILWKLTETRERLDKLELIKNKAKELGLTVQVTGKNALYLEMNDYVVGTFFYSIGIAIVAISLLMIFLFKSVKFGLVSLLPNLVPLAFITGIMTLTGINIDIGTALVCSVCLGIAIDDTIHFMFHYYKERKEKGSEAALLKVMDHTGKALLMTSVILIFGFGFFMLSEFIPNIKFGFLCSLTIGIALVTDFFLLPAVLFQLEKKRN